MNTATAELTSSVRKRDPNPGLTAACELMATDWSPWHIVLYGLNWADYRQLLAAREAAGRKRLRVTYAGGVAEIMTPGGGVNRKGSLGTTDLNGDPVMTIGNRHERWKKIIARLIEAAALGFRLPLVASGNLTINRADLDRGLEPDECYYVQNASRVIAVRELDFSTDPPPDLVIEIEVSRTVTDRLELYASLGVPEVWRYDGDELRFLILSGSGYIETPTSLSFSHLTASILGGFLHRVGSIDDTELCQEVMDWARQTLPKK